ncbi:SgcJ/EcaC family oxidoreductase [Actinoplanes sp. M2I2]|uniref:SgcJ/EcaC family oxidoreductase n=1 Tax=Actinoplanes sp. M2I2 TaxID=1734444 RepID=UPI0020226132|nr:SgcJ/EcaC family oxidoreductase [Actinoplanes sp. M2I2]
MNDHLDRAVLRGVLDAWREAVDRHLPDQVADLFAEDAVFQGLHPYSVGRAGVKEYYAGQPMGMTVAYDLLRARRLADDVVLAWVAVEFTFAAGTRAPLPLALTVIARRDRGTWRIAHYHVSPRID